MFEKCVKCAHLGKDCTPYLFSLPLDKLWTWYKHRKNYLGWSNADLAEKANVPKGTIDAKLSGRCSDVTYTTVQAILSALIGSGKHSDCPSFEPDHAAELEQLEDANKKMMDFVMQNEAQHNKEIATTRSEWKNKTEYLKDLIRDQKHEIILLRILLTVAIILIIGALVIDRLNGNIGFIWRY